MITATLAASAPVDWHSLGRGLLGGSLAVLVSGVVALWLPRDRPGTIGIPLSVAVFAVLRWQLGAQGVPVLVIVSAVCFAGALEWIARATARDLPLRYIAIIPGTAAFVLINVPGLSIGTRIACAIGAAGTGIALSDFDRRHERDGLAVPLLLLTCVAPIGVKPCGAA